MPSQGQQFDIPGTAVVSGWGTLSSGGATPTVLQWVEVPLVSDDGVKGLKELLNIHISSSILLQTAGLPMAAALMPQA